MRLCELRQKEVINICDGQRLGFVEDMEFDLCKGKIQKLLFKNSSQRGRISFFAASRMKTEKAGNLTQNQRDLF